MGQQDDALIFVFQQTLAPGVGKAVGSFAAGDVVHLVSAGEAAGGAVFTVVQHGGHAFDGLGGLAVDDLHHGVPGIGGRREQTVHQAVDPAHAQAGHHHDSGPGQSQQSLSFGIFDTHHDSP